MIRAAHRPAIQPPPPVYDRMPAHLVDTLARTADVPVARFLDAAACVVVVAGVPVLFTTEVVA